MMKASEKYLIFLINIYDSCLNIFFDLKFGIKTRGRLPLHNLDIRSKNIIFAKPYQPTNYRLLNKIFNLPIIEHSNYNFIDIGSGLGRTLIMASKYPFKKIIGVEFAHDLVRNSLINIENYQSRCSSDKKIIVEKSDILDYIPPTGPNIYFLYNPFNGNILKLFLEKIGQLNCIGKNDLFIYVNPIRDFVFHLQGFNLLCELPHINHNRITRVYSPPSIS